MSKNFLGEGAGRWIRVLGLCSLLVSSLSIAEPIVESRSGGYRPSSSQGYGAPHPHHHNTLSLPQIEALEHEIRQLRGQLEVQEHELKRLTKTQQELYKDLERKLQAKNTSKTDVNPTASTARVKTQTEPPTPVAPALSTASTLTTVKPNPLVSSPKSSLPAKPVETRLLYEPMDISSEEEMNIGESEEPLPQPTKNTALQAKEERQEIQEMKEIAQESPAAPIKPALVVKGTLAEKSMYENAYNLVLNKRYSEAVPALQAFLAQYPQGQYAPNGHYWLGEVYSVQGRTNKNSELLNKASVEFMAITTQFPNHQKAMDALLKLGLLENDKGNTEAARQYLTHVKERYPGTSVARIASTHLQRLK